MKTSLKLLSLVLLLALSGVARAQFTFTTNADNTLTLTGYSGTNPVVTIPNNTNGMVVTAIGSVAFYDNQTVTSVVIPDSVTTIGDAAFEECWSLTNVTIPDSVTSIGRYAFYGCIKLTSVSIGTGVTYISFCMFSECTSLPSITIPSGVTDIAAFGFNGCESLRGMYFTGNAPTVGSYAFEYCPPSCLVYYLPGTTGWGAYLGIGTGWPLRAFLWNPQAQNDASFGVQSNQFGFNIAGSSNLVIVVEACADLVGGVWSPVSTNTLNTFVGTNGTSYFSDPQWTIYPARHYRFRSP